MKALSGKPLVDCTLPSCAYCARWLVCCRSAWSRARSHYTLLTGTLGVTIIALGIIMRQRRWSIRTSRFLENRVEDGSHSIGTFAAVCSAYSINTSVLLRFAGRRQKFKMPSLARRQCNDFRAVELRNYDFRVDWLNAVGEVGVCRYSVLRDHW